MATAVKDNEANSKKTITIEPNQISIAHANILSIYRKENGVNVAMQANTTGRMAQESIWVGLSEKEMKEFESHLLFAKPIPIKCGLTSLELTNDRYGLSVRINTWRERFGELVSQGYRDITLTQEEVNALCKFLNTPFDKEAKER